MTSWCAEYVLARLVARFAGHALLGAAAAGARVVVVTLGNDVVGVLATVVGATVIGVVVEVVVDADVGTVFAANRPLDPQPATAIVRAAAAAHARLTA